MIVETYHIDKTIVNIDDSFFLVTESEKKNRMDILHNLLAFLVQKISRETERKS